MLFLGGICRNAIASAQLSNVWRRTSARSGQHRPVDDSTTTSTQCSSMTGAERWLSSMALTVALVGGCVCANEERQPSAIATPESGRAYLLGEWRGKGAESDEVPAACRSPKRPSVENP